MGFLSGLLGGILGGGGAGSGIGNSTTSQTTTYNEKYANVADYAKYSNVGDAVSLEGLVGNDKISINLLDGGAIKQAFQFAGAAGKEQGQLALAGEKLNAQTATMAIRAMGVSTRNAIAHVDQTGTRNRDIVVMGVVMVGGVVLMVWLGSGGHRK